MKTSICYLTKYNVSIHPVKSAMIETYSGKKLFLNEKKKVLKIKRNAGNPSH